MDNRTNILDCALALFADRGYDAVGIQEIVDAAGITKPTLYHYFGSKRGLIDALLAEHFRPLHRALAQAATYQGDLSLALHQVAAVYFGYARARPLYFRLQLGLWFAPPHSEAYQAVSPLNEEQQRLLEEIYKQAAEEHDAIRGRHRVYAATFLSIVNAYIALALEGDAELNDVLADRAVHQFIHGILTGRRY
jgi:TetR/AcrR family transcriptional regulator